MFDLNNNNISTVLLLIILGLSIWYLTKPNNEKFTNNNKILGQPIDDKQQILQEVNVQQVPQLPQIPQLQQLSQVPQLLQASQVPQLLQVQQVPQVQQAPQAPQAPQVPQVTQDTPVKINSFEGYDNDNYTDGADIDSAFLPPVAKTNTVISAVDINKQNIQNYDAKDFLPKEINDQWFDTDFSQAKNNINDDKLINTERYVIGINTVGQSLKNASYDIRGTIANPKFSVSPWNNSTYEPDYNIKPLC